MTTMSKKVKRLLDRFSGRGWIDKPLRRVRAVCCAGGYVVVKTSKKYYLLSKDTGFDRVSVGDLDGCLAGRYNTGVYSALDALSQFKDITDKEESDAIDWLHRQSALKDRQSALKRLQEDAAKLGLELVRKEADNGR
jgi:hypothetical protein